MIIILQPHVTPHSADYRQLMDYLTNRPNIQTRVHQEVGTQQTLTEIYLIGDTASLDQAEVEHQPGVERVVRVSEDYRILGRHHDVEVLTTCARDYVTWRNELPAGEERVNAVVARRFPVHRPRVPDEFGRHSQVVFHGVHSVNDELAWLESEPA